MSSPCGSSGCRTRSSTGPMESCQSAGLSGSNMSLVGSLGGKPGSSPFSEGNGGSRPKHKTSPTSYVGSRSGSTPSPVGSSGSRSRSSTSPIKLSGSRPCRPCAHSTDGSPASSLGSIEQLKSINGSRPSPAPASNGSQNNQRWNQVPPNVNGLDLTVPAPKTPGKITTKGRLVQYSLGPPL